VTRTDYQAIARACDRLLASPNATLETTAVSWLHVHNEHPVNLQKYAGLGMPVPLIRRLARAVRRSRTATLAYRYLSPGATVYSAAATPVDVLFVSHLLNAEHAGGTDFYFGGLPELLQQEGIRSAVALRNHSRQAPAQLAEAWHGQPVPRIVLGSTLSVSGELELRRRMAAEARRLSAGSPSHGLSAIECAVRRAAAVEALGFGSRGDLRLHYQLSQLVQHLRPRTIVVTYEGHGWERLAFHAARQARPGIRCIGYQHTILFPQQHAILRPLGPSFDPDVVLTVGDVTRSVLAEAFGNGGPQLKVLGSARAPQTPAVRPGLPGSVSACLVIPDGTVAESLRMFRFAVECAQLSPATRFIFRTHPVLPFRDLATTAPDLDTLPNNVEVSTRPIAEDIARAGWALYRGSSAVLAAVLGGVRPLYLHAAGELPIDPLHRLAEWKRVIEQPADLVRVIAEDKERVSPDPEAGVAFDFCSRYIVPLQPDALVESVNGSGASGHV
jgi:hypothetical protein